MKKERLKLKDKITKNQLYTATGVFVCLFSAMCMVNQTSFVNFFTWCFSFIFGFIGSYIVYFLIFLYGLSLIFKKQVRIKMSFLILGLLFILFGIIIVITNNIYSDSTSYLTFSGNLLNGEVGNYSFNKAFEASFLNFNEYPFPTIDFTNNVGILGLLVTSILNSSMSNIGSYVFGSVFIVLGSVFVLLKLVIKFARFLKGYVEVLKKKEKFQIYKDAKDVEICDGINKEVKKEEEIPKVLINDEIITEKPIVLDAKDDSTQKVTSSNIFNKDVDNFKKSEDAKPKEPQIIAQNEIKYNEFSNTFGLKRAEFDFVGNKKVEEVKNIPIFNENIKKQEVIINSVPKEINNESNNYKEKDTKLEENKLSSHENLNNYSSVNSNFETDILKENETVKGDETIKNNNVISNSYNEVESTSFNDNYNDYFKANELVEEPIIEDKKPIDVLSNAYSTSGDVNDINFEVKSEIKEIVDTKDDPFFKEKVPTKDEAYNKVTNKRRSKKYDYPPISLLNDKKPDDAEYENFGVAEKRKNIINEFLNDFKMGAEAISYKVGPSFTRFNIQTRPDVSVRGFDTKMDDLSRKLAGQKCRFVSVVPNETTSGIEIKNPHSKLVSFKEVFMDLPSIEGEKYNGMFVPFGQDISGKLVFADFRKFPHLLVTGTTGSGKSVFIQTLLLSLIMRNTPDQLKLIIIDPKQVEFARYKDIPHLMCPIITEYDKANNILNKCVEEMNNRYAILKDSDMQDIKDYNAIYCKENHTQPLPYIVAIVDEYADLIDNCKTINLPVQILSAKARACGIHLLIATQSPRSSVINGVIKNNFTTRVALLCASSTDSINVINQGGAEKLAGNGDMLIMSPLFTTDGLLRVQGAFVDGPEIKKILDYIRARYESEYVPSFMSVLEPKKEEIEPESQEERRLQANEDEYESVKEFVMENETMSISKIQRNFPMGFNKAGKFFERLKDEGIIEDSASSGAKGLKVLKRK